MYLSREGPFVDEIAHQHQCVAPLLEVCQHEQLLEFLQASMNVTNNDHPAAAQLLRRETCVDD